MNTPLKHVLFLTTLLVLAVSTAQAANITVDAGSTCTLADAITSANNDSAAGNGCTDGFGADTITLQTDVTLAAALPEIASTITIEGGGHKIDGNNDAKVGSVLRVANNGELTLNEATVTGGYNSTSGLGGGIYNDGGTIILTNSTVSGNSAFSSSSSGGGGIYSSDGSITLTNSTVSGNSAFSFSPSSGGGICSYSSTITLNNSTVSGNSASSYPTSFSSFSYGGGIFADNNSAVTLNNSTVSGNSAASSGLDASSCGGGIQSDGTITLNNSTVSGNSASSYPSSSSIMSSSYGGGLNTFFGTITLTNSTVSGNSASVALLVSEAYSEGGGLNTYGGTITLINSTVSDNTASSSRYSKGGGINTYEGTIILTNSTVSGNSAFSSNGSSKGGGIWNYANSGTVVLGNSTVILRSSLVSGNTASSGNEVEGTVTADRYNLFGHDGESSSQAFSGFTPGSSDLAATSDGTMPTALDAILSPLANNGGPTPTHALPAGSPAIDLDTTCSTGLSTDQRGYPRPVGSGCDAGAYELGTVANKVNMAPIYKLLLKKR